MPTEEDIHTLEAFKFTSPLRTTHTHQLGRHIIIGSIPIEKWRKRLAMALIETIHQTFDATTQHNMTLNCENHAVPRNHY